MKLSDRIKLAWAIATDGKAAATLIPTWQDGTPSYSAASFENAVRFGWRRNELIFSCVNKTAAASSFVHLQVTRKRDGEELPDHELQRLLARPNPFMDEFDFWQSVVIYQKLAGGAYYEKERDRAGRVIALWPLRPDWIQPIKSQALFIGGYAYTVPGTEPVNMRVEDVLDFRLFDPLNQYRGYPPAAVAGRVGDIDNATTDYLKLFMEKGGTPPGLLTSKQKLLDNDIADIRRRWGERYGGYEHWMAPAVLDSDATYQKIGLTFDEMGFDVLDARSEARICMVLDIPPIIVGAKMGLDRATYSNYEQARSAWWEDTLVPMFRNFENVVNNDLVPEYGQDIAVAFDFGDVPALKEAEDSKWARANEGLGRGYLTINEARSQVGLEEIGEPGDIFLRPSGATTVNMNAGDNASPESAGADMAGVTEQQVLNGAQIQSALSIIDAYGLGKLPRDVAVFMVQTFFNIPRDVAEKLVPAEGEITQPKPDIEPVTMDPDEDEPVDEDEETEQAAAWLDMESKAGRRAPDDAERRKFERRLRQGLEEYFDGQRERIADAIGEQYRPVISKNGTANE